MPRLSDAFLLASARDTATANIVFGNGVALTVRYAFGVAGFSEGLATLDSEEDAFLTLVAEKVLVGWENLQDDDGSDLEVTMENKMRLLSDYEGIIGRIVQFATEPSNFSGSNEEELAKN